MGAVGLEHKDLFPERPADEGRPRAGRSTIRATDLLRIIDREAQAVALVAADFLEHRTIDEPTWERLSRAVHRIGRARDHAAPARAEP